MNADAPFSSSRKLALMSERELVAFSAVGDRDAYGELVRRHARFVRDLIRRMGAQPSLADDLAQDTFIEAMRSLPGYRLEAPFAAWIRTIAARQFMRKLRQDSRAVLLSGNTDDLAEAPLRAGMADRLDLNAALQRLSKAERMCVTLCHGAGLKQEEISEALDVPLGTVKSHVTRGLAKLRQHLGAGRIGKGGKPDV